MVLNRELSKKVEKKSGEVNLFFARKAIWQAMEEFKRGPKNYQLLDNFPSKLDGSSDRRSEMINPREYIIITGVFKKASMRL